MLKLTQMMLAARRHGQNVEEMFRAGIRPEAILLNASLAGACNLQPSTYSTILLGRWRLQKQLVSLWQRLRSVEEMRPCATRTRLVSAASTRVTEALCPSVRPVRAVPVRPFASPTTAHAVSTTY